jgi:hypothetical protein
LQLEVTRDPHWEVAQAALEFHVSLCEKAMLGVAHSLL